MPTPKKKTGANAKSGCKTGHRQYMKFHPIVSLSNVYVAFARACQVMFVVDRVCYVHVCPPQVPHGAHVCTPRREFPKAKKNFDQNSACDAVDVKKLIAYGEI